VTAPNPPQPYINIEKFSSNENRRN